MSVREDFPQAVEQDLGIDAYQPGLRALGQNSTKLRLQDGRECHGSVDLDAALRARQPQAPRWDYAVAYRDYVHFVEVHPADTSEVSSVLAKLDWLKGWLNGTHLGELPRKFHWVASGGKVAITKSSKQHRQAALHGLLPVKNLPLT